MVVISVLPRDTVRGSLKESMKNRFIYSVSCFAMQFQHYYWHKQNQRIKLNSDQFRDYFMSLKAKAIENYDKSILALEECLKIEADNATIHFELGKSLGLKRL
jgi:hypothetical protein